MIDDEDFKQLPFEDKIKIMNGMTERQINEGLEQIEFICKDYCGKCPSYQGTGEVNLAFCSIGKSSLIKEKKGCLCKHCPVTRMMSLRWEYYCTEGKAQTLSKAEK
jgi:hypothetical protein